MENKKGRSNKCCEVTKFKNEGRSKIEREKEIGERNKVGFATLSNKRKKVGITPEGEYRSERALSWPWPLPPGGEVDPAQLSYCPKAFMLTRPFLFCYCFGVGMEMQSNFK